MFRWRQVAVGQTQLREPWPALSSRCATARSRQIQP